MGVKWVTIVDQPLGLSDRVVRAEHDILRNPLNPSRTVRQRPAKAVSGTGVAGPPAKIPIPVVHPCILAGRHRRTVDEKRHVRAESAIRPLIALRGTAPDAGR